MYVHNINPTLLSFGPFEIRFYGIVYALALLGLVWWLQRVAKENNLEQLKGERAIDFVVWCMVAMLIGARLMHVLSRLPHYLDHPLQIFAFWQGGLAFFGGFIGTLACGYYLSKRWELSFSQMADIIIVPIPLFLMLGRIANFINAEHQGKLTTLPWGVLFPNISGFRHPSQLYDAALMLVLFIVLFALWKSKYSEKKGLVFWAFVSMYGVLRLIVEFFREVDAFQIFGLSWMHYVSLFMLFFGAYKLYVILRT